jgi:hypothetical protein
MKKKCNCKPCIKCAIQIIEDEYVKSIPDRMHAKRIWRGE